MDFSLLALVLAAILYILRAKQLQQLERPGFRAKWALPTFLIIAVFGWFLTPEKPFTLDFPVLGGFNFVGGLSFSPEFLALLIGLSVYTGAFIAEIVRSGIQAVAKGQREAAKAVRFERGENLTVSRSTASDSDHHAADHQPVFEPC